jgi:hypothetical protein
MDDIPTKAWLHQCGHLNQGDYSDESTRLGERAVCGGCSFEVKRDSEVVQRFTLIPEGEPCARP